MGLPWAKRKSRMVWAHIPQVYADAIRRYMDEKKIVSISVFVRYCIVRTLRQEGYITVEEIEKIA